MIKNLFTTSTLNEQCWILLGQTKGQVTLARKSAKSEGQPTQVEFDHAWLLEREVLAGDVAGFIHTHPSGILRPSRKDINTMRAWVSCFGRPLLCLIACDNEVAAYEFRSDSCQGVRVECESFGTQYVVVRT